MFSQILALVFGLNLFLTFYFIIIFIFLKLVKAFTQNTSLVYEPEKGGKFSLFDNNIQGTFISLVSLFSLWRTNQLRVDLFF